MAKTKNELTEKIKAAKNSTEIAELIGGGFFQFGKDIKERPSYDVIPTQFNMLNTHVLATGGFARGRLVEIAGSPGIGKSSICQCLSAFWQKSGFKVLWVPTEPIDEYYAAQSGMNMCTEEKGCTNPIGLLKFTTSEDLANKLKLFIALDMFDAIIVDSVQAVNTEEMAEASEINMHTSQSSAKFWTNFLKQLEGGFTIKYGTEFVQSEKPIVELKNGKFVSNPYVHKLNDKKTCVILINHLKSGVGMFSTQYTPGGIGKDFTFTHRLFMNPTKGGIKKASDGQILWKDVKVTGKKSKLGAPSGRSVIMRLKVGIFEELGEIQDDDIDDVEGEEIDKEYKW